MRKSRKATIVIGSTAGALALGGVAFAYWSSTGTGSGTGSTSAGTSNLAITGGVLPALYPGQAAQDFTATVKNNAANNAFVAGLSAYVTTSDAGCDGSNFSINGSTSAADPVTLTWPTPGVDLAHNGTQDSLNTIQFINKDANQDLCKGVDITLHYASN